MLDTNLMKSDLEEICCGLGISTEGTKADLIQRIRDFSSERNCTIPEKSDNEKRINYDENDELTGSEYLDEEDILELLFPGKCEGESSEILECKMILEFKKLENAVLGFNDRLNLVSAQIRNTWQRVEINEA
ncbi:1086_t:CDS:2 [Dentiscutata heterogama]|uniref:1086_t:CDS:1 n=1 Tax=Dentiscutata heterogama TaxID=1316150 RepID=A0ACA9KX48_9GLOM|nr:1086_t:CDS:2 [Dentiscutata heterogama]